MSNLDSTALRRGQDVRVDFEAANGEFKFLCGRSSNQISFTNGTAETVLQNCEDPSKLEEHILPTLQRCEISGDYSVSTDECYREFLQICGPGTEGRVKLRLHIAGLISFEGVFQITQQTFQSAVEGNVTHNWQSKLTGALGVTHEQPVASAQ